MTAIAALGDVDIDLLVTVDEYPRRGQESFARDSQVTLGGSAANTAAALAHLGFEVSILAQVGDDEFGARAQASLAATGIDTRRLLVSTEASTGMNVVVVTADGERTMLGLRGANRLYPGGDLDGFGWLHLSGYAFLEEPQRSSALAALAQAHRREIPVSVDVPSGVAHRLGEELAHLLAGVSIVSVGKEPLAHVVAGPDPAAQLLAAGVGTVAVTDGHRPVTLRRDSQSVTLAPPRVEVVDTTGAGDSFVAGLVAGALWGLDLGPTATVAAALGAAATSVRGSGSGSQEREALRRILDGWTEADPGWVEEVSRRLA